MEFNTRLLGRFFVAANIATIISGCAVSSVFSPYPSQAQTFKSAMVANSSENPNQVYVTDGILLGLSEERESADSMLYMMERGRIAQVHSKFEDSKQDFQLVIDKFEQQDLASTIEASDVAAKGAAMLTNDNAIPYSGAGYERIFTHHHQAFNYWGLGDLEGASIEFRKVSLEQQILLEKYEAEIAEAQEEAEENDFDINTVSSEFAGLDTVAGQVKSSFQNAYTFYTSAAFWEATGELNNALVDYKKAYEINPSVEMIKQDIARISKRLGTPVSNKDLNLAKENEGTVVILFEDGFVPSKTEVKISLPTLDGGIVSVAFPTYDTSLWPRPISLKVLDDNFTDYGLTHPVADVGALAVKDLKEQIPAIAVRQALRAFAKYEMQKQSGDHLGLAGALVANLYNILSESADRRSWLTLPNSAQALRINLPEGSRELSLSAGVAQTRLPLDIAAKKTTFVRVVHVNNQLIPQVFQL